MKKVLSVILALLVLVSSCAVAESVLPNLSSVFSVDMPSLRRSAMMDPVSEETMEDGGIKLTFEGITEDIFNDFSSYLTTFGCTLESYDVSGSTMTAVVGKENATFSFAYNYETLQAVVIYPKGTNEEIVDLAQIEAQREAVIASYQVGNYVTFGNYPQGANGEVEPVEWLVLDVQGDKALLISRYALDCQPYNTEWTDVTWETCTLCQWLNESFISNAFSEKEQKAILTTEVDNSKSQGCYDTDGGNNTQDKVFLLSYVEAWKYFENDDARKCRPTEYAVAQNAYEAGNGNCWWWLRSPGSSSSIALDVAFDGLRGSYFVDDCSDAVRPAFWLDLTSDIF